MKFFVLTFSDGKVVSDYFGSVYNAELFACNYCKEHNCSLSEMLGMPSIDCYLQEGVDD